MRFHKTEIEKQGVLKEKAFKVFFLRTRTRSDCARFLFQHTDTLHGYGSEIVNDAFIYQNNLYINFFPLSPIENKEEREALDLLYALFNMKKVTESLFLKGYNPDYDIKVMADYFDHNGFWLSDDIIRSRHKVLKQDLTDIADMIREQLGGKRLDVFNSVKRTIVDNVKRVSLDEGYDPNPYLSRVEIIIPMNFLHIFKHIRNDTTTDVIDLEDSVRYEEDTDTIDTFISYTDIPASYEDKLLYDDMDIFPRYIPVYAPYALKPKWNWLLYEDIDIETDFMDYLEQLHFKGHYMFSYEKAHIIKDKVKKINDDISSNHTFFYLTDLSIGIAFPFMISLFAFIHLKTELSFLFMFKNKIRELLFIFWLLPVLLMLIVKGGIFTGYLFYLMSHGIALSSYIIYSLLITFILASTAFYHINRWCFSQFTGDKLNLYALHKGR
jgi:hypothetical protein